MSEMSDSKFKFTFKTRNKRKFLDFSPSQISVYSIGAQLDFCYCLHNQLEAVNGFVFLYDDLLIYSNELSKKYNELSFAPKTLEKLYLKNALINFFKHGINSNLISDWKVALELFETAYE